MLHLIHGGARRIAILTGPEHLSIGKNRMKGYLKALTEKQIEVDQRLIVRCDDFSVEAAKEAVSKLLESDKRPDAIFGINDDMAIGALEAVKEKTVANITKVVNDIIDGQVRDGRFANAEITFKDIAIVKKVFIEMLTNIYHSRIAYPALEKKEENNPKN